MNIVADNHADTLHRSGDEASTRTVLLEAVADAMRTRLGSVESELPTALLALAARLEHASTR